MRKGLLIFLSCLLCYLPFVAPVLASPVTKTIIVETQLDDSPTSVTGTWNIEVFKMVAFFVKYVETEVGSSVSIVISLDFSYDTSSWVTGYFYDFAGGSTLQTTETFTEDSWYYFWLEPDWQMPYVRVTITATGTDVDDLATVTSYLVGLK